MEDSKLDRQKSEGMEWSWTSRLTDLVIVEFKLTSPYELNKINKQRLKLRGLFGITTGPMGLKLRSYHSTEGFPTMAVLMQSVNRS